MARVRPSIWEQVLFWPHRPPDLARYEAAQALRTGQLPVEPGRAAAAVVVARRNVRGCAVSALALVAVLAVALDRLAVAGDPQARFRPAAVAVVSLWAAISVGRSWRRRHRVLRQLDRLAAFPMPRGPVITITS